MKKFSGRTNGMIKQKAADLCQLLFVLYLVIRYMPELTFLNQSETDKENDGACGKPGNQSDPITKRPKGGICANEITGRKTDDPVRDKSSNQRIIHIFIAAQSPLNGCSNRI